MRAFLSIVEPRQAQRFSNLAQQASEAGYAARKALETPLTQMLDFRRGLASAELGYQSHQQTR